MITTRSDDLYKREGSDDDDDYACSEHMYAFQRASSPFAVGTWSYTLGTGRSCWACAWEAAQYAPHRFLPVTMFVLTQTGDEGWSLHRTEAEAEDCLMQADERYAPVAVTIFRSDPAMMRD